MSLPSGQAYTPPQPLSQSKVRDSAKKPKASPPQNSERLAPEQELCKGVGVQQEPLGTAGDRGEPDRGGSAPGTSSHVGGTDSLCGFRKPTGGEEELGRMEQEARERHAGRILCWKKAGCLSPPKSQPEFCLPRILTPISSSRKPFPSSPPCPLTEPGKRCCPLYKVPVSGTSQGCGIWHMNHSPSWEINYSSKRKTKHFTNCPERKELGKGWEGGQASGWRLPTFMKGKEGKSRGKSLVWCDQSTAGLLDLGLSLCWFIPVGQHSLQWLWLQQDNHVRVLHLCSDLALVLQAYYPFPQASLPGGALYSLG